jgi:hypothetical protein
MSETIPNYSLDENYEKYMDALVNLARLEDKYHIPAGQRFTVYKDVDGQVYPFENSDNYPPNTDSLSNEYRHHVVQLYEKISKIDKELSAVYASEQQQIRTSPERSAQQEWTPTRYEIELISRYEKEFAVPEDQRITEWFGDLNLYEVKSDVTETIFTKRLEHILEQTDLTLEEINSGLLSDSNIQTAVERSLLTSSPAEESIVAQYTDHGVLNVIKQYPSGKFYNHYGYDPKTKISNSRAGAYHSLAEAKEMMERHRSKAVELQKEIGEDDKNAAKEVDSQAHLSIQFAKRQVYGEHTINVKGQEITYVNVALPKTSKYHGYALSINKDRIRDDKFSPKMAFISISDKEYTLSKWDKTAQKAQEISLTAQQLKKEFDSWKEKKRDTPVR